LYLEPGQKTDRAGSACERIVDYGYGSHFLSRTRALCAG